jgi:hypothetical protein
MRFILVLLAGVLAAPSAWGWPVVLRDGAPRALTTDADGNVLAAVPQLARTMAVAKYDRAGRLRWRRPLVEQTGDTLTTVLAAANGDAVAAGWGVPDSAPDAGIAMIVGRLDASRGALRWRTSVAGTNPGESTCEGASAAALDGAGDVVAAGTLSAAALPIGCGLAAAKLDGATGGERWRFTLPVRSSDAVVATLASGDVVVAGNVEEPEPLPSIALVRLAGTSGAVVWWRELVFAERVNAIAVGADDDIVLAVSTIQLTGDEFGVVKLASRTGDVLWVARETGSQYRFQEARRVAIDASGDVVAAGMTNDGAGDPAGTDGSNLTVVRLDGVNGNQLWTYHLTGSTGGAFADLLQLAPTGLVAVGGWVRGHGGCQDPVLVELDDATGTPVSSRTFEGTLRRCRGAGSGDAPGARSTPVTYDTMVGLATGASGHLFAGMALTDRRSTGARTVGVIHRLATRR